MAAANFKSICPCILTVFKNLDESLYIFKFLPSLNMFVLSLADTEWTWCK